MPHVTLPFDARLLLTHLTAAGSLMVSIYRLSCQRSAVRAADQETEL